MDSSELVRTALLVMDFQTGIVERVRGEGAIGSARRAVGAARSAGVRVIFVRVAFRPGFPEVSPRNASFSQVRERGGFTESDPSTQVHPDLIPAPGEPVAIKRRVSAFAGSDLEVLLRAGGITHLVLTGLSTSGVVLSTIRQAADLDYAITVLGDGCADSDAEVHRVLLEKVFPRQARVTTVDAWASELAGVHPPPD
ncbi:MAG TPA: cysteine hydrolase [Thermoplasmata archaeon]|nr:cysteine hydrolase [Thermoplasmata archaeon]